MALTLNGAGSSAADPILAGMKLKAIAACSSLTLTVVNDAFIDPASAFPGSNSVKASLSPAATVVTAGSTGSFSDTTNQLTVGSTAGMSAGDAIFLSHASITDGVYLIDTVVSGTEVTIQGNPFDGANRTNIFFQIAWSWTGSAGAAPLNSTPTPDDYFFKFDGGNGANNTQIEDFFFIADAPTGADYIEIAGNTFTGGSVNDPVITLDILRVWASKGGIGTVELVNHGTQAVNNFTWTSGGGSGQVPLSTALLGITASAGDGAKYGRFVFKSIGTSTASVFVDFDVLVDTSSPVIGLSLIAA